jgi:Caspase domain
VTIRYQCEFVLTLSIRQPPSLFALIIGINKYKSALVKDLEGSIADAEAVKTYLQDSLGVPPSRIKTLFNEHATRDGIIQALRALNNANIKEGDPILIFYAGHGVAGDLPKDGPQLLLTRKSSLLPHMTWTIQLIKLW